VDIDVRKRSDVQVLHLRGDLRLGDPVNNLKEALDELIAAGENRIILDIGGVRMIDSSGIGVLVRFLTATRKNGGVLKLVNPSEFAVKTLRLVGVLNLFEVFTDEQLALDSFHEGAA
jgi:anti-sigma B factor antagonist